MKPRRLFLPLSLVLSLFVPLARPAAQDASPEARRARVERGLLPPVLIKGAPASGWSLEERMRFHKVPGLSVAVIKDFKVEWAKGYGVKDTGTREPVSERTLFQAGSISKPVAAMAALKKVEQGRLSLEEDVNSKLTSWKLPENEFTKQKKVTLANLLSHTAGLTVHGFPGYAAGEKVPTVPQVLDGAPPANTAPVRVDLGPGTRFRYSGGGTTIAQLMLTDTERKPFPDIVRETVLKPLGMEDTTYEQPPPAAPARLAAYAGRYLVNPDRVPNVTFEGGRLFAESTQGAKVELFPISETTFARQDSPARATFAADKVTLVAGNNTSDAPRRKDAAPIPYELLQAGKADEAVAAYRGVKKEKPDNVAVSEQRLNTLGYELLRAKKLRESIAVFALNAELYPQSFNVYDSLGDAYRESGEKELAIKNYRRSLELNPQNRNATEMLKKLEGEKK